jgi:hypothetical protein
MARTIDGDKPYRDSDVTSGCLQLILQGEQQFSAASCRQTLIVFLTMQRLPGNYGMVLSKNIRNLMLSN